MTWVDVGVFGIGWALGWLLLWRNRPLPPLGREDRDEGWGDGRAPIAVIVPARDEATAVAVLVPAIRSQLRPGDEFVVVDDHSDDATAATARALGARVIDAPELAPGWLGKPNACWSGTQDTSAPTLLFLDADVAPADDLLDRIGAAVARSPGTIISVEPWHRTRGIVEQASLLCNVTALMGSGAFTVAGGRLHPRVAFGPVLAIRREDYDHVGGHRAVRSLHTEDIGLARLVGRAELFTGRPDTSFRMYPDGLRQVVGGWTRSIATGMTSIRWWSAIATAWWVAAIAGGWLAAGWPTSHPLEVAIVYGLCATQVWVLGRRAGSIHPLTALLYPVPIALLVAIVVRSTFALAFRRDVTWKGRRVAASGRSGVGTPAD